MNNKPLAALFLACALLSMSTAADAGCPLGSDIQSGDFEDVNGKFQGRYRGPWVDHDLGRLLGYAVYLGFGITNERVNARGNQDALDCLQIIDDEIRAMFERRADPPMVYEVYKAYEQAQIGIFDNQVQTYLGSTLTSSSVFEGYIPLEDSETAGRGAGEPGRYHVDMFLGTWMLRSWIVVDQGETLVGDYGDTYWFKLHDDATVDHAGELDARLTTWHYVPDHNTLVVIGADLEGETIEAHFDVESLTLSELVISVPWDITSPNNLHRFVFEHR